MTGEVTVRYWAAAKAAGGTAEERASGATLAEVLAQVRGRHDDRFGAVLDRCSFLVDSDPVGTRDPASVSVPEGALVDCLPPFAGG